MSGLLDFLQAASNAAASNVSGPIDLITAGLRAAGVPVPRDALLSSEWMERKGLTKPVKQSAASLAGETAGLLTPVAAAAKAPQIAKGLLQHAEDFQAYNRALGPAGASQATVWHGSPHRFDKFDSSKIGTGEGAQAYGHGLYLAESPDVAKSYAESVSRLRGATTTIDGAGRSVPVPLWAADRVKSEGIDSLIAEWARRLSESQAAAKKSLQPWIDEANAARFAQQLDELQAIKASGGGSVSPPGSLYKVDLPDEAIAKMLDWDKPLSQQPEAVRKVAEEFLNGPMTQLPTGYKVVPKYTAGREVYQPMSPGGVPMTSSMFKSREQAEQYALDMINEFRLRPDTKGAHIYSMFDRDQTAAADMMRRAGIPGIRYLDGGSRGAGGGTSNFVVFPGEEGLLKILERNGSPL